MGTIGIPGVNPEGRESMRCAPAPAVEVHAHGPATRPEGGGERAAGPNGSASSLGPRVPEPVRGDTALYDAFPIPGRATPKPSTGRLIQGPRARARSHGPSAATGRAARMHAGVLRGPRVEHVGGSRPGPRSAIPDPDSPVARGPISHSSGQPAKRGACTWRAFIEVRTFGTLVSGYANRGCWVRGSVG
jgi:hypothetical protein